MNPLVKLTLLAAAAAAVLCGQTALGAGSDGRGTALIELTLPAGPVRGRLEARTDSAAWLLTPAGRIERVPLAAVTDFRRAAPRFAPLSRREQVAALKKSLGPGGAVFQTRRYLIVRHNSRVPGTFGSRLERTHAAVTGWFTRYGAPPTAAEFPLVAVVLPDFEQFAEVAAAEGVAASPGRVPRGLKGYYSPTTNRLTVWEPPGGAADASFHDTLVHEAVHQIAFNGGLHHRTGGTPRWVAEGLATALEAPAFLSSRGSVNPADRVNPDRLRRFRATAHEPGYLNELVCGEAGDDVGRDPLGFYADAWALTFFLMHTRGGNYARYLAAIGKTTAAAPDAPADRRAAFVAAFGVPPSRLEAELGRFVAGL